MLFAPALFLVPIITLMSMPDFATRASMFGIASQPQVMELIAGQEPNALFLDVRSQAEIDAAGKVTGVANWKQSDVTPMAAPELEADAAAIVGSDKDTPIVIYCGSGKRANKAKEVLEAQGYKKVINAGGFGDVGYLSSKE